MQSSRILPSCGSSSFAGQRVVKAVVARPRSDKTPLVRQRGSLQVRNAVKEVFMPALSSTMTEGKIVSWLKGEGDKVGKGEALVVVESDKADMDVESFNAGFLGHIVVPDGGVANVGEPIAYIADTEAEIDEAKKKAGAGGNGAVAAPPVAEPAAAPEDNAAPEPVAEADPVPAPEAPAPVAPPPPPPPPAPVGRADGRIIATPYAKKLAKKLNVDLKTVGGTGPAGRITAADVENRAKGVAAPAASAPTPVVASPSAPAPAVPPPAPVAGTTVSELRGTTEPFTSLQKAVVKGMVASLAVPEFRVSYTIETDKLDALYKTLKPHGVTMTALLAKACGIALAQHPVLFACKKYCRDLLDVGNPVHRMDAIVFRCTEDGEGITYNEHANVAIAVAMPDGGLITPVLKDCDTTDIYTMSRSWGDLVKRARAKKLTPDEFTTGTFTISNLGMFGVDSFDAILPVGTAAILAVGGSKPTVVANADGMIGVKKQMTVNITCDHRIVYGAHAAEFLKTLKEVIENPDQLTL